MHFEHILNIYSNLAILFYIVVALDNSLLNIV